MKDAPPLQLSWPWRAGCHASIQAGGMRYLPHIRIALNEASESIDIELYMCSSGALFDEWLRAIRAARKRGVRVRMLLDAIGSRELDEKDQQALRDAGVQLEWFNPLRLWRPLHALVRDHRKLIIVDNRRAWTGGMGINDSYDPRIHGEEAWLDAMVEIHGPVVDDFSALFEQAWQLARRELFPHPIRWRMQWQHTPPAGKRKGRASWARVNAARGGRNNPLLRTMVRRILRARSSVWLCTPYFLPPRSLQKALLHAGRRGVTVNLTLAGPETDHPVIRHAGHHLYTELLDAGVIIHEYMPRFMHLKAARVDNWSTLGSFNYDRWNSNWNLEANVEIVDQDFSDQMEKLRQQLENDCQLIETGRWGSRSSLKRWHGGFWYWFGTRLIRHLRSLWRNTG